MNTIEYEGIYFNESTPLILREVIKDCIGRKVLVHVLTGDPLTGIVTPQLDSVGYIAVSDSAKPMPIFNFNRVYSPDGEHITEAETHKCFLSTDRILKINEVDSCALLYQSYECKSSPLRVVTEVNVSPYGDVARSRKIICDNPKCELLIPEDADAVQLCEFLFGKVHYLSELMKQRADMHTF